MNGRIWKPSGALRSAFRRRGREEERAVALFLNRKIGFLDIAELIEACMEHHRRMEDPDVDEILAAEAETYEYIAAREK